ncbi:MAG: TolC family protein [Desulfuromonadaceae bacterium]|nr:TolC family protein [Desulfuromonadaceae bacterium]
MRSACFSFTHPPTPLGPRGSSRQGRGGVLRELLTSVALLAAITMAWPALAQPFELPYLFSDPLRTMPGVVEKGVILPGDSAPIPRSVQKNFAEPLTLDEAVDLALSNNQKVKSAWADIKVQSGAVGEAYSPYLPVINGSVNWTKDNITYSDSRYPSSDTSQFTFQASATLRILDFGGRAANRRSAENLLAAALASYDATIQDALSGVIQAYFDATTAAASLKAKTEAEEVAKNTLSSAKDREAKGVISQSDTLRAATALARASLNKNRARGDYHKALALLRYYLGLPGGTVLLLPPELNDQQVGIAESKELSLWLDEAQKNHPMIASLKKQLEAAQQQVTVVKSAGLPILSLSGNYYQNTRPGEAVTASGSQETTLTLALSIPLFDGFASTYKLRGAQAKVEKQISILADIEHQIAREVIKAHSDATSALQNLEASLTLLESAKSALAVSQRKYDKGAADITEVLSTQSALADAWNERVRSLAEWHSSRLQLLASTGRMGRSAVAGALKN